MKLSQIKKYKTTHTEQGSINFYQEMEMSYPNIEVHEDISYTKDKVSLHSHSFYELVCCDSGNVQYLLGTDRYRLQSGDIILVPPGVSHRPLFLEQLVEPYHRYVMWWSSDFVTTIWNTFFPGEPLSVSPFILRTAGTRWDNLPGFFKNAIKELNEDSIGWQMGVTANAIQLMLGLIRARNDSYTPSPLQETKMLLDEILEYIEHNLTERISLSSTARHFLISESSISQLFRKKMNISFYQCVTQRRLINAKIMIVEGQSLDTIAISVGFNDYSTFYRAFKKEYGISPIEYKKMMK